jgi:hypothetical protein
MAPPRPRAGARPPAAPAGIGTRRLLAWGDLDERRRRRALPLTRLRWPARALAGAALAALVAERARLDPIAASRLVLAATVVMYAWVMLGTPARMYWRVDAPLLARLPIPGRALFDLALVRSLRATLAASVVVAPAVAALLVAPAVGGELAARHAVVVGTAALAAALLLPAVALGAGTLIAGGKAAALVRGLAGGELAAPPVAWLGVLPGLAAAGVVLVVIASARWALGGSATAFGPAAPLFGGLAGGAALAVLAARRAAAEVMPLAMREVAALDVQRLAHLEIHPPSRLERAIGRRLGARAALVHGKDARLLRRRFPLALLVGAATTGALWIVALVRPEAAWSWVLAIVGAFAGYALLVAWRLTTPPIELPYAATLPLAAADRARGKRAYLVTYALLYPALGGAAVVVRLPDGPLLAAAAAAVIAAALAGGSWIISRRAEDVQRASAGLGVAP